MRVLIDGDACPILNDITSLVLNHNIEVIVYHDISHNINIDGVKSIECDIGYQSVDMKLVNDIEKGDLVISQDYGVAVISLSKEAYVLDLKGNRITNDNIDLLLYQKYINNKNRKQRIKTVNPKKSSKDDDNKLLFNIEKILIDHN